MPLIQRIEVSNLLNSQRIDPWRPDWPHQVFDLNSENTAMNIPNGKGKSTMVLSLLAMLTGHMRSLNNIRMRHYAPRRTGRYTHIRVQMLVTLPGEDSNDLVAQSGGGLGGSPMVFGLYGNSGENERVNFYAYRGTFDDCNIALVHDLRHDLVSDKDFLEQMRSRPDVFRDPSVKEWLAYLDDFFDMSNLHQQLIYQLARGAEGDSNYFEVKRLPGRSDGASIFYERLAPELLSEVMGQLGNDGEKGIEDTIHEKVSGLIVAKRNTAKKAGELRRTENTLKELEIALQKGSTFIQAKEAYDEHLAEFATEVAAVKNVLIDDPIPGIPLTPPEHLPALTRSMVMQGRDGHWYLPDRVMAEFTGEEPRAVNQRARDRHGISLTQANNLQVIDFYCDLKNRDPRGKPNQLYTKESAIALLNITNNFTQDWNREKAIAAVMEAFDWIEANADTNPARLLDKQLVDELDRKNTRSTELNQKVKDYFKERDDLRTKQQTIGEQQAEYRRMSESGLFTSTELADPKGTGENVTQELADSTQALNLHKDKTRELKDVYALWRGYHEAHGETEKPIEIATRLIESERVAKVSLDAVNTKLLEARGKRSDLKTALNNATSAQKVADDRLKQFNLFRPKLIDYQRIFGDDNPVGLEKYVIKEHSDAKSRKHAIEVKRSAMSPALAALTMFRNAHGTIDPATWIEKRLNTWETKGAEITELNELKKDAVQRRSDLNNAAVAPGKIAREAMTVAGGNSSPLHEAIGKMSLSVERRQKVLTLFSSLLHAPVYQTLNEAADAARNLAEHKDRIESPVFVFDELADFSLTGDIPTEPLVAHTWLVGVRTRPVDCLLDPSLVDREKAIEDERINDYIRRIGDLENDREGLSTGHINAEHAPGAAIAVKDGFEASDAILDTELAEIDSHLPQLEYRSSDEARDAIKGRIEIDLLLVGGASENSLIEDTAVATQIAHTAQEASDKNEADIDEQETIQGNINKEWILALSAIQNVSNLHKIQDFIDHPQDNPAFMSSAPDIESGLAEKVKTADSRTKFRFLLADDFVKNGDSNPREIEERIKAIHDELAIIQDKIQPKLNTEIEALHKKSLDAKEKAGEIDELVRSLIRKYREFMGDRDALGITPTDNLLSHPIVDLADIARQETDLVERINSLLDIASDLSVVDTSAISKKMQVSKQAYGEAKSTLASHIELTLVKPDLDLSDHVKIELIRGKEDISVLAHIYKVTKDNFEKNSAANATAQSYLDKEWGDVSEWLQKFTLRLPDNLRAMRTTFAPQRDSATGTIIRAGFDISAKLAELQDIKATLDDIVLMVENYEKNSDVINQFEQGVKDKTIANLRREIRNNFYQKVILDPSIHVCMPSISQKPLPLEKEMVSTGQGIAMTLLWIVKMANYVTERELSRKTSSSAQLKRLKANKTQFTIIDGAFSSLSNKELIDDALNSVAQTRGNFQLIITGHDENYQNNFHYFPTLVVAREIGGKFMYADSTTKRMVEPSAIGSHYGAMALMNMRVTPKHKPDESNGVLA
jgi:hypothetical protein